MHFVKKAGLWLSLMIFSLGVSIFTFSFIFTQTAGKPDTVKSWLSDSDFYANFITVAAEEIKIETDDEQAESLLSVEDLKDVALQTFTAEDLQAWAETVIDGVYPWLEQNSQAPAFEIDIAPQAKEFAVNATAKAQEAYLQLPSCSSFSEAAQSAENPLNATCQVPNVDFAEYRQQIEEELLGPDGPFSDTSFTQDDIKVAIEGTDGETDADKQPFYQRYTEVPNYFSYVKKLPWIGLLISLLMVAPILFLARSKQAGLRKIGWRLVTTAIVNIIGIIALFFGSKALTGVASSDNEVRVEELAVPFVNEVITDILTLSTIIAVCLLAIGIVVLVLTRASSKHGTNKPKEDKGTPTPLKEK